MLELYCPSVSRVFHFPLWIHFPFYVAICSAMGQKCCSERKTEGTSKDSKTGDLGASRKSVAGGSYDKKRAISIGYHSKGDDSEKFDKAFETNDLKAWRGRDSVCFCSVCLIFKKGWEACQTRGSWGPEMVFWSSLFLILLYESIVWHGCSWMLHGINCFNSHFVTAENCTVLLSFLQAFVELLSSQQAIESFDERMHPWAEDPKTVGALAGTQLAILASAAEQAEGNKQIKHDTWLIESYLIDNPVFEVDWLCECVIFLFGPLLHIIYIYIQILFIHGSRNSQIDAHSWCSLCVCRCLPP